MDTLSVNSVLLSLNIQNCVWNAQFMISAAIRVEDYLLVKQNYSHPPKSPPLNLECQYMCVFEHYLKK